jgi:hypothetical protein
VFTRQPPPPPGILAELAWLRAALPGYDVTITARSGSYRFEAICRSGGPGLWCLISTDPADLLRELVPHGRHTATAGIRPPTPPDR